MARPLRIQYPGAFYHITSRGNEQRTVFRNDTDRKKFLFYLQSAHERYGALIHCFCLLPNHYHLLLETPRGNLSQVLHYINGAYTTYFNIKRKRFGHLFQGRFKSILVEKEAYAQELSRYIHLNPLRAGLTQFLNLYPWSSYVSYVGIEKRPSWLETRMILGYFSLDKNVAQKMYREFVEGAIEKDLKNPLESVVASTILGSSDFVKEISGGEEIENCKDSHNVPALKALKGKPSLPEVEEKIAEIIPREHVSFRKFSIYIAHRFAGRSLTEIGNYYGMKGATVSQAAGRFRAMVKKDAEMRRLEQRIIEKFSMSNVET